MYYDFLNLAADKKLTKELGFEPITLHPLILTPKTSNELKENLESIKNSDFSLLRTNSEKIMNTAIKNVMVDAVDGPIPYNLLSKMAEHNIAILINFNELLHSHDKARTFQTMQKTVRLVRKYKVPIIMTSGAGSDHEQRSLSELIAFGEMLKMTRKEAEYALFKHQEVILERNKLKKEGKWVAKGIKVV